MGRESSLVVDDACDWGMPHIRDLDGAAALRRPFRDMLTLTYLRRGSCLIMMND